MHDMIEYNNCCVACGEIIPEGRQVCSQCERKYEAKDDATDNIQKKQNTFINYIKKYFI
jgi:predicted nucleic acid-binding Zn ribbon protein